MNVKELLGRCATSPAARVGQTHDTCVLLLTLFFLHHSPQPTSTPGLSQRLQCEPTNAKRCSECSLEFSFVLGQPSPQTRPYEPRYSSWLKN